jgi:hypothetical protein
MTVQARGTSQLSALRRYFRQLDSFNLADSPGAEHHLEDMPE